MVVYSFPVGKYEMYILYYFAGNTEYSKNSFLLDEPKNRFSCLCCHKEMTAI